MNPAMREIARATAEHFDITVEDVRYGCRKQKFAWPRQIAMALSRYMGGRSLPEIGIYFGGKDHTTAMHAIASVEEHARNDDETLTALISIAAHASGMSIDRQRQEREWAQELRCGPLSWVKANKPAVVVACHTRVIMVPNRSPVRGPRRPVAMPSEFAPPTKARLMGSRA